MGTFSIWHWLIVLSVLAANVAPIKLANKGKTLTRLPYFFRFLILVVVAVFLKSLGGTSDRIEIVFGILATIIVMAVFGMLWAVHRVQDIGWSKWWSLLLLVPAANLIYLLALLLWPGRKIEEQQEASF